MGSRKRSGGVNNLFSLWAVIIFHDSLTKREWLNRFKIFNYNHAYRLVFQYIETFYNTVRIHSHCGYLSPNEYEKQYKRKLEKLEKEAV